MMRKLLLLFSSILIPLLIFSQLPKIIFSPHWLPQAQFAGFYMAKEKGFYAEEGIDVDIIHPSVSAKATERLASGKSDIISLFLTSALCAKNNGLDLVNIAQLSQNSALLFVTKKSDGIVDIGSLAGKKIGIWNSGFDEIPKAFIRSSNYKVSWIPILSSINMFVVGGVDAMTVMWYNEYDQIIHAGMNPDEMNTFFFSDYGYNIPEDGLYCLNQTLLNRKGDLQKFVKGTLRGWEYAKANPDESLEIVMSIMKQEHVATNMVHQRWMLEKVLGLLEPGTKNVKKGELAESDFLKTQSILYEGGDILYEIGFRDFYKPVISE